MNQRIFALHAKKRLRVDARDPRMVEEDISSQALRVVLNLIT